MDITEWLEIYKKIVKDLKIDETMDYEARNLILRLGKDRMLDYKILKDKIYNKSVAVIGFAIKNNELDKINEDVLITSGKSVIKIKELKRDFIPDVHVTDLEEEDLIPKLEKNGCIIVAHAHGDNIKKIKKVIPKLSRFIATTQVAPIYKVYNFGGFTDGDRAALLAKKMGAKKVTLYGFDFENVLNSKKRKKMKWAKYILQKEGII